LNATELGVAGGTILLGVLIIASRRLDLAQQLAAPVDG
jgi:hypothetical protein